ncbi:MAG TPA: phospholipase D-like domain-containing protein, partial [Chitinophagaceae bacterium]|nr:phospholipase D-like domain-containing protein [Chitinophagaceae bacterium]
GQIVSIPRTKNLESLNLADIPEENYILREAEKDAIQHNKFIVFKDKARDNEAVEVWTGSTNITMGGIHGQTNVGHWVRNAAAAKKYEQYWHILSRDPGALPADDKATKKKKRAALKESVEKLQPNIDFESWDQIPMGITPVFSPRSGGSMLETYVGMFDSAERMSCVTLAFGINKLFKDYLTDNTPANHLSLLLLEKKDTRNARSKEPFVFVGAKQNVYKAWGSYIQDDLYQWAKETTTRSMKLNMHVAYIHSKFLLVDPLTTDPVVVTGSANFSAASTNTNDENMIIIRGNTRVADIYFTEFNRLFQHYYFRAVLSDAVQIKKADKESLFLCPTDKWTENYAEGK